MNEAVASSPAPELAGPERRESWSRQRWWTLIALVFAAHVALIFFFGTRKSVLPRALTNVPQLQLADSAAEWVALDDPTLFALPNVRDFSANVWLQMPVVKQPAFRWTEKPRWLPLAAENLGAIFSQFMQTNQFATASFEYKPSPELSAPKLPLEPALPQASTLQITGDLAPRAWLNETNLPPLPGSDVIAPSRVQVLVDEAGNVVSAVMLPSDDPLEAAGRADVGETKALDLARTLRFAPASRMAFGELIFNWHTVPMTATNAP